MCICMCSFPVCVSVHAGVDADLCLRVSKRICMCVYVCVPADVDVGVYACVLSCI